MRAIVALFIVLAVAFVCVGTSAAGTGGDVKSSPLFKRSLEESIASLEGKAPEAGLAKGEAENMPTGRPGCTVPNASPTEISTCVPSFCGSPQTCEGTCAGKDYTCSYSCLGTCSGPTCSSTCAGGSCPYHYIWRGKNWWNYNGDRGTNWNDFIWNYPCAGCISGTSTEIRFVGSNPPPKETSPWSTNDGYYNIDKWYSSPITNLFDVQSWVGLKTFCYDTYWVKYWSEVVHSLSPPDDSGIHIPVDFYFYCD